MPLISSMKWPLILAVFLALCNASKANDSTRVNKKILMVGANALAYKGSLQNSYNHWTPGIQVGLRFEKRKLVNGMLSATFGTVIGEDRAYKKPSKFGDEFQPVSKFETSFFSLHYEAQVTLFRYKGFRLFISQGVGLFRFTPKDWQGKSLIEEDRTRNKGESYSKNSMQFPTQIGLLHWFPNQMGFGFQTGWLNPLSNYIDNMSDLSSNDVSDNVASFRFQFFYHLEPGSNSRRQNSGNKK
jgi:hypothetical protein